MTSVLHQKPLVMDLSQVSASPKTIGGKAAYQSPLPNPAKIEVLYTSYNLFINYTTKAYGVVNRKLMGIIMSTKILEMHYFLCMCT